MTEQDDTAFHPGETIEDEEGNLVRTAASYDYLDKSLRSLHLTSVPMNDEEALDYFGTVALWFDETDQPRYIMRRPLGDNTKQQLMPYEYNYVTGEVQKSETGG